jgi:hypothetical protein
VINAPIWDNGDVSSPDRPAQRFAADPQAIRRFSEVFSQHLNDIRRNWTQITETMRPITQWAQSPAGQETLAAMREQRETEQSCHCVCTVGHPGLWPCEGVVLESEIVLLHVGDREVPVCSPCAEGWRASGDARALASIDRVIRAWEDRPDAARWRP